MFIKCNIEKCFLDINNIKIGLNIFTSIKTAVSGYSSLKRKNNFNRETQSFLKYLLSITIEIFNRRHCYLFKK